MGFFDQAGGYSPSTNPGAPYGMTPEEYAERVVETGPTNTGGQLPGRWGDADARLSPPPPPQGTVTLGQQPGQYPKAPQWWRSLIGANPGSMEPTSPIPNFGGGATPTGQEGVGTPDFAQGGQQPGMLWNTGTGFVPQPGIGAAGQPWNADVRPGGQLTPRDISPAATNGPPTASPSGPGASPPGYEPNWLGRTLGVGSDREARSYGQQMMSGLGAGLQSVGQNWNKPGLAALAGSAGSAMQGGEKERHYQQGYDINRERAAAQASLYTARADHYDRAQKFQTGQAFWRSSQPGLLWSAEAILAKDQQLATMKQALNDKSLSPEDRSKMTKEYNAAIEARRSQLYHQFGVDPSKATTGGRADPHKPATEREIQSYPAGHHYIPFDQPTKPDGSPNVQVREPDRYNTHPGEMPSSLQAQPEDYSGAAT